MWRSPFAKVRSISGFTSICETPGEPIFHRLLDRDDAALHRVDAAEETIKRRRFSRAGRAGDENDSVRLREQRLHDPGVPRAEVEAFETELLLLCRG